jgi:membrane-bound lytic murein transglycosylase B
VLTVAACLPGLACGGGAASPGSGASGGGAALAGGLVGANATLRRGLEAWAAADPALRTAPPRAVLAAAARERAIVHRLAGNAALAGTTLPALPASLARAVRTELAAAHALRRLDGPPPKNPAALHLAPPRPAGRLLADYRLAQARFGVRWQVLAAVNMVETAFGRVVVRSSAGAQGPMQFMPATWSAYGLGGNVQVPHDAILGAANYLHRSGAPADERAALHAYNPSNLYVDAVLDYARVMARDRLGYLTLYAWEASLPAVLR